MRKEHIYIDLADLLVENQQKRFLLSELIKNHITVMTTRNPAARIHIFYSTNHTSSVPKPGDTVTFYIFDQKRNIFLIGDTAIKTLLKKTLPTLALDSDKLDFLPEAHLPVLPRDGNRAQRIENSLLITSDNETFKRARCDAIEPTGYFSPKPLVKTTPFLLSRAFSLNTNNVQTLTEKIVGAKNKGVVFAFDFDYTIIHHSETLKNGRVVLIEDTINRAAELFNAMDDISNVTCMVLSARPDDAAMSPERVDKIATALPLFLDAINERIKQKHPQGISISDGDIVCLQSQMGLSKEIALVHKKNDSSRTIVVRKLVPAVVPNRSLAPILPPNDNDPSTYEFRRLSLSSYANKAIYLEHILLPKMKAMFRKGFIFAMIDDSPTQIDAINALAVKYPDSVFTLLVQEHEVHRTSNNRNAFTPAMANPNTTAQHVMEKYRREKEADKHNYPLHPHYF